MGLLRFLRKLKLKEKEMRILFLGLDNAGKSSVIKAFMHQSIDDLSPTLGFEIKTVECQGYRLSCWDVGGQSTIRAYWRNYFEATDGVVWVPCDRCLDDMEQPITSADKLMVKFGTEYAEEGDNLIVIPEEEGLINVAWFNKPAQ